MSLRSVSKIAFTGVQLLIGGGAVVNGASKTCSGGQLSCHTSSTPTDTCCNVYPGGQILQTQFWDTDPSTGPDDSWTVHGLWPDHCDGSFDQYCDESRQYKNITQILQAAGQQSLLNYMDEYWPDYQGDNESFWEHEFGKHATCISTFDPKCYSNYKPGQEVVDFFTDTVKLFKTLDTYSFLADAGIYPSSSKTYSIDDINDALYQARGVSATVQCASGALDEVWYTFNIMGSIQSGKIVPAEPNGQSSSCGSTVKYLPKN